MNSQLQAPPGDAHVAYEHIAPVYDQFTAHHDYDLWLPRLLEAAEALGLRGRRLLDVACGTGKSFLPLLETGWQVTGCDISESMLRQATEKAGERARLFLADMRALPRFGSFDLVWALDDAINYLLSADELERCLTGLRRNLAPEGLVMFDLNTLRCYRSFFAETQVLEHDGHRLSWRGEASPDAPPGTVVEATFEVGPLNGGGGVEASAAVHRQRHFTPEEIDQAIRASDLECLAVFGHGYDAVLQQPLDEARHTKAIVVARSR